MRVSSALYAVTSLVLVGAGYYFFLSPGPEYGQPVRVSSWTLVTSDSWLDHDPRCSIPRGSYVRFEMQKQQDARDLRGRIDRTRGSRNGYSTCTGKFTASREEYYQMLSLAVPRK